MTRAELEVQKIKWKKPELSEAQKRAMEELRRKQEEEKRKAEEEARRKAEEDRLRREKDLDEQRRLREEAERKRLEELKKKQEEERKRLEEERKRQEELRKNQAELDKQKQEELRKKQEEERKRQAELNKIKEAEQKRQEEIRKQQAAEQARKEAEQRRQEEARRQAEAERQRVEAEKRRKEEERRRGEAAARSAFSDLGDAFGNASPSVGTSSGPLTSGKNAQSAAPSGGGSPKLIGSATASGAGSTKGINNANIGNLDFGPGETLTGRDVTQVADVDLGVIDGSNAGSTGSASNPNARSRGELSSVLDRLKAQMGVHYNRALRKNPTLGGKLVVRITIEPNGTVSNVSVVDSDINDEDLIGKILTLIRSANFGAKEVGRTTANYPIDFNQ